MPKPRPSAASSPMAKPAKNTAMPKQPVPKQELVDRLARDLDRLIASGERLGIAVSGGPDSLALLLLCAAARPGLIEVGDGRSCAPSRKPRGGGEGRRHLRAAWRSACHSHRRVEAKTREGDPGARPQRPLCPAWRLGAGARPRGPVDRPSRRRPGRDPDDEAAARCGREGPRRHAQRCQGPRRANGLASAAARLAPVGACAIVRGRRASFRSKIRAMPTNSSSGFGSARRSPRRTGSIPGPSR